MGIAPPLRIPLNQPRHPNNSQFLGVEGAEKNCRKRVDKPVESRQTAKMSLSVLGGSVPVTLVRASGAEGKRLLSKGGNTGKSGRKRSPRAAPTFVSLFSGCGGFDWGFSRAGYKSLGAFDIDPLALDNLHGNMGTPIYRWDLSQETLPPDFRGSPDVVLSGSPCQGFSTMGKRDVHDHRNSLLLSGARIALSLKPKVFIAENVPGVVAGKHKMYWEQLADITKRAGYHTKQVKVNAQDFGVPQSRIRMLLFAWRGTGDFGELPKASSQPLGDALKFCRGLKNHDVDPLPKGSKEYMIASRIKQGQKLSNVRGGFRSVHTWDIPEVFGQVTKLERWVLTEMILLRRRNRVRDFGDADPIRQKLLESMFGKRVIKSLLKKCYLRRSRGGIDIAGVFNGGFRRLSLGHPSYTVDTRFGLAKYFLHPRQNRGMTVREAARIQGFPDDFVFTGARAEQYKMVGNAVPPPMSYHLAHFIYNRLLGI